MMMNLRTVWPFRSSYPRSTAGHKILAAIIFAPLLILAPVGWLWMRGK